MLGSDSEEGNMGSLKSGIQYRHWRIDNPRACVLLVHGLAEHTGRYERVAARFNERGIAVVGPDPTTRRAATCSSQAVLQPPKFAVIVESSEAAAQVAAPP